MPYTVTTQRDLRRTFWRDNPNLSRRKIPDHSGYGKMHVTDTRVTWCDWLDYMSKSGMISQDLAERAEL